MEGRIIRLLFLILLLAASIGAEQIQFTSTPLPDWNATFERTNGWTGADAAFSIPLSTNRVLWLFGDTWVGRVIDGKRRETTMINNTIGIQNGANRPEFFYHTNQAGKPVAFFKPADGKGFFWPFHGVRTDHGLFLLLHRMHIADSNSVFGFQTTDHWMASIKNPDDAPPKWKVKLDRFPFYERIGKQSTGFGCAVMQTDDFVYIYGNSSRTNANQRGLIVARVAPKDFGRARKWKFYANGEWVNDFRKATAICPDAPSEASVSFQPTLRKYVMLYSLGLWGRTVIRTAPTPVGPWSETTTIYECPEMKISDRIFCYAAKGHPEISKPDEIIFTYAANSRQFADLLNDARLYWPRFVRVKFTGN